MSQKTYIDWNWIKTFGEPGINPLTNSFDKVDKSLADTIINSDKAKDVGLGVPS